MYIIGASILGEIILGIAERNGLDVTGFYDDVIQEREFFGKPVLGGIDALLANPDLGSPGVFIAIGENHNRRMVFEKITARGIPVLNVIDSSAVIEASVELGTGNLIMAGAYLGVRTRIGHGNLIFPGVSLTHHNQVGDFNFFSPNASVGGYTCIENECKIAMNCSVAAFNRIESGTKAIPCTQVVGVPLTAS